MWQYRLYVPEKSDYVMEFYHNVGVAPIYGEEDPIAPDSGQHTITLQVAEDMLAPNDVIVQTFMVSFENRRAGISFASDAVRSLSNNLNNFENQAFRYEDFLAHDTTVHSYDPGEVITLLHIKDTSKEPKMIEGKRAEIIIRLVPRHAESDEQGAGDAEAK